MSGPSPRPAALVAGQVDLSTNGGTGLASSEPFRFLIARLSGLFIKLRGKDSNLDYLIQSQASYH